MNMSNSFAVRPNSSSAMVAYSTNSSFRGDTAKWSARFPAYQIDFTAVASGKRIAATKRRVRWRFGFSNKDALEAGETGTACRGEEHDVTIVWSISSGKRLILADGQEVHYSTSRAGVLEYSWTMRGSHVLKVMAHATPPMSATPGFRQYDLHVDGQSFFYMPKVYELGLKGPISAHDRVPGVISHAERFSRAPPPSGSRYYDLTQGKYIDEPKSKEQEEADLQRAIQESLEESRRHLNSKSSVSSSRRIDDSKPAAVTTSALREAPVQAASPAPDLKAEEQDLLVDFLSDTDPAPVPSNSLVPAEQPANQWSQDTFVSGTAAPSNYATVNYASSSDSVPVPSGNQFDSSAAPAYMFTPTLQPALPSDSPSDPWAPQATYSEYDDPFAPQPAQLPTYNDISSQIMQSYTVGDDNPAPSSSKFATVPGSFGAEEFVSNLDVAQVGSADDQVKKEEEPQALEPAKPKNDVDEALEKLVNLGDLTAPPEELTSKSVLSMNPFDEGKDKKKSKSGSKGSKGTIPRDGEFLGAQPTLGQMKAVKPSSAPMKPVMPMSPSANVGPGALVLYGTQNGNFGGYGGVYGPSSQSMGQQGGYGAPLMQQGYSSPPLQMQSQMGYSSGPQQMQGYGASPQMQQNYGHVPSQQQYQHQQMPPQQGFGQY